MTSIKLKINSYKKVIKNKKLVEIINNVISSYPFSFVNLERLRKEVDSIDELFWIKDEAGRFLLVNNKFASSFHLIPSQIEGKPVDKFIPAYFVDFNKALDEYIKESGNIFIIEGFPLSGVAAGKEYQTIEIPILSTEGKISAIIVVGQKSETKEENVSSTIKLFEDFIQNYFIIDKENLIVEASMNFCDLFSINISEVKGRDYHEINIPVVVKSSIDNFIKSEKQSDAVSITLPVFDDKEFKLHLKKDKNEKAIIIFETLSLPKVLESYDKYIELMLLNNPEPAFIYDKENLKFLYANDAALKLYGYSKNEFLQLDLTDLYVPEDIQTLLQASEEKFKEGEYSRPQKQKRKNGSALFVEINRLSITYKETEAYLNIIKNSSERLKLENESQQFKAVFNNIDNLIFITDREGFIISVNNSVIEVLGYSPKSLKENSFASLLADDFRGKINSTVFQSSSKEKLIFETSIKKADKEFIKAKVIVNPVFDYKGDIESYIIICQVTQEKIKEITKEVIKEIPVVVEKESEVAPEIPEINFLSGLFHDLLTPINIILGFANELTEYIPETGSEQKEAIAIIDQNKEDLLNKMNQVIDYIQIEKNKEELNLQSVKIIDVIENLKKEIDDKKVLGDAEFAFGKISSSLEVITDKQKLHKLFIILIKLISKFISEEKIYISAYAVSENQYSISLRNELNSSSEKLIEKLSSFFVDDKSSKETGISLFSIKLCKLLLSLLHGTFKISEEKERKEIVFVFPIKLTDEDEFEDKLIDEKTEFVKDEFEKESSLKESDESQKMDQHGINLSQLSCLYIEDQPDSQLLFSLQMNDLKEIRFAISLEQSIPLLRDNSFDFIVVDINLQGDYNGLDILKLIKTMPEYENIPVIAISAYYLPINKEIYIKAGFSDFISKPIQRDNLLNSLESILLPVT